MCFETAANFESEGLEAFPAAGDLGMRFKFSNTGAVDAASPTVRLNAFEVVEAKDDNGKFETILT